MESEKTLETLEEELKLIKGELKQSLASVRDYLLNMELPSSEFSTILAALSDSGDGVQKVDMKSSFAPPAAGDSDTESEEETEEPSSTEEQSSEEPYDESLEPESELDSEEPYDESLEPESELDSEEPYDESLEPESELGSQEGNISPNETLGDEAELLPDDELMNQDESFEPEPEAELPPEYEAGEEEESFAPESELSLEEEQMEQEKINAEMSQSTPKVNLLANLINWVARAKKEIGYDQIPVFLEVYGISGHLSPELKEAIMHLSEITSELPEDANKAEIWSQSMLSLHGILTGGNAPAYPIKPSWTDADNEKEPGEEEIIEVDKAKDTPVKLKLEFPNGDGGSKEFCINLTPETDNNDS